MNDGDIPSSGAIFDPSGHSTSAGIYGGTCKSQLACMKHLDPTILYENDKNLVVSIVMGVPKNGWFMRNNPIEMDNFGGTTMYGNHHS